MLLTIFIAVAAISYNNFVAPKMVATWDFTNGRAPAIVGWPTDKTHNARDWWAPRYKYKQINIILPGRPNLVSDYPANVFFDRNAGQMITIQINERPVTREQALERLRSLAREWDWPWEENEYQKWVRRTDKGTTSRIGAGEHWEKKGSLRGCQHYPRGGNARSSVVCAVAGRVARSLATSVRHNEMTGEAEPGQVQLRSMTQDRRRPRFRFRMPSVENQTRSPKRHPVWGFLI